MQMEVDLLMKIEDVIDVISMNTVEPCNAITLARSIINDDEYNVYDYVGGSIDTSCVEPCQKLKDGWYRIYSYDGFVAFVEF
jgi:hypothetical protein